jgi:uncharacterized damage-inducible protein DinB
MENDRKVFEQTISRSLSGKDSHVEAANLLAGLDWKLAGQRPHDVPHSVFQLVNHITYWQEWIVKWLDGKKPRPPKHASGSWPGRVSPANRKEWERTVGRFLEALDALNRRSLQVDLLSKRGKMTRLEMLHIIGSHTSYHAGQVVFLRQMLASWPPPSGGVTW